MRPERRTSGSVKGGSSGPRWGTCRWQNLQRMGFEGQDVVRWCAREGMFGNVVSLLVSLLVELGSWQAGQVFGV